ncbi:MAG: hypothetical protein DMD60_15060 [Gemmatimonadetes bacterium]|nr:MAG: hypothetical protein DMD60_15060 [Gemmatimonadota bacterium]
MPAPPPPRTPQPPAPQAPRPRNPRTAGKAPHGVLEVDWPFFGEMCRALALKIFREYDPDLVIGIARAGVIPGAVVASILQNMAIAFTKTRRIDEAIRHYRRALELDRELAGAHYGLAFLLLKRGDPDGAAQHLRAFLAHPPKGPDAQKWIEHATQALRDLGASGPTKAAAAEAP